MSDVGIVNEMLGAAPAHVTANAHGDVERALWSGAPVLQRDPKLCEARNHSCKGPKALGTRWCVGHLRSQGLLEEARRKAGDDEPVGDS